MNWEAEARRLVSVTERQDMKLRLLATTIERLNREVERLKRRLEQAEGR